MSLSSYLSSYMTPSSTDTDSTNGTPIDQEKPMPPKYQNPEGHGGLGIAAILVVLLVLFALICAIYYTTKLVVDYLTAKGFSVTVNSNNPVSRIGETITLRISLSKVEDDGQISTCRGPQIEKLDSKISILVQKSNATRHVAILRQLSLEKDGIIVQFSVRKSGTYTIAVKVGLFNFIGSPYAQDVLPGPLLPSRTVLDVSNPSILCIVANKWNQIELKPKDRYGNPCDLEDVDCSLFKLSVKFVRGETDAPVSSPEELEHNFEIQQRSKKLMLNVKISAPNLYKGQLSYGGLPIDYGNFTIVCMTADEDQLIQTGQKGFFGVSFQGIQGTLLSVGAASHEDLIWINMNSTQITISQAHLGIYFYPSLIFRISRRTQINFNGLFEIDRNQNESTVTFKISDVVQPAAIIAVKCSNARVMMAAFSYLQGQKLTNYEFKAKVHALKYNLSGYFSHFQTSRVLRVDSHNLLTTTIRDHLNCPINWFRPMVISIETHGSASSRSQTVHNFLSMDKWLTQLIQTIFEHQETGLFSKYGSSKLLHPTLESRRSPDWSLFHYEFAGMILGKLTRSFLAQLLGIPVTYQHLKTDDPAYYHKYIKPLLESKEVETKFTFTDIEERPSHSPINLIPNGSNIRVTKRNKIKFLNLLAHHKLVSRYNDEITAFRDGLYTVIPQAYLTDFDEDSFLKVMCSGSKSFKLEDLKANCRIVGDVRDQDHPTGVYSTGSQFAISEFSEPDRQKVLKWLWTALANMSDSEHEKLLKMTTGSPVLPSCGFRDLSPKFTISLTGNEERPPTGHPSLHQISLGNHATFQAFEKNLLDALYEDEKNSEHNLIINDDTPRLSMAQVHENEAGADANYNSTVRFRFHEPQDLADLAEASNNNTEESGFLAWVRNNVL